MKRIGKSKEPTLQAIHNISINLREKLEESVFVNIETGCFSHLHSPERPPETEFGITIVPREGKVIVHRADTWPELLKLYHKLMEDSDA